MAQTKPDSSRAIAAVTTLAGLPVRASLRYRAQSRTCAFQAISRIRFGCSSLRVLVDRDHGFRWKMITQSGGT
jgi:hypothetical protein